MDWLNFIGVIVMALACVAEFFSRLYGKGKRDPLVPLIGLWVMVLVVRGM